MLGRSADVPYNPDPDYIDRARHFFRIKTEKQADNKALETPGADEEIGAAHGRIGGKGRVIEELFE